MNDRSTEEKLKGKLSEFVIPKFNRRFFIRLAIIAGVSYLFFGFVCVPAYIKGESMEPTYNRVGVDFCWRPRYWFTPPKRGDVVVIRYTGHKLYLKRLIGLPGDTIEFKKGKLVLNGRPQVEPYVQNPCDWTLPPRKVPKGRIYVIGDNRSMPMENHKFGAVKLKRLYGAPLW
jgi:signal peptidase I